MPGNGRHRERNYRKNGGMIFARMPFFVIPLMVFAGLKKIFFRADHIPVYCTASYFSKDTGEAA